MNYFDLPSGLQTCNGLEKVNTMYLVLVDDSRSYMGLDYGPPDPPPSMETMNFVRVIPLESDEQLRVWVEHHTKPSAYTTPKPFKVFQVSPVEIRTRVEINFVK